MNHSGILPVVPTLDICSTPFKCVLEVVTQDQDSRKQKKIHTKNSWFFELHYLIKASCFQCPEYFFAKERLNKTILS